ncbi:MAG: hypothetical protein ABTD50_15580 [Polyangiaceae bacterium]|jgi:hypothetical protein
MNLAELLEQQAMALLPDERRKLGAKLLATVVVDQSARAEMVGPSKRFSALLSRWRAERCTTASYACSPLTPIIGRSLRAVDCYSR